MASSGRGPHTNANGPEPLHDPEEFSLLLNRHKDHISRCRLISNRERNEHPQLRTSEASQWHNEPMRQLKLATRVQHVGRNRVHRICPLTDELTEFFVVTAPQIIGEAAHSAGPHRCGHQTNGTRRATLASDRCVRHDSGVAPHVPAKQQSGSRLTNLLL